MDDDSAEPDNEAAVDALIEEFGGDPRSAMMTLMHDIDCEGAAVARIVASALRRQRNSRLECRLCRRATIDTVAPGSSTSATIARFSAADQTHRVLIVTCGGLVLCPDMVPIQSKQDHLYPASRFTPQGAAHRDVTVHRPPRQKRWAQDDAYFSAALRR